MSGVDGDHLRRKRSDAPRTIGFPWPKQATSKFRALLSDVADITSIFFSLVGADERGVSRPSLRWIRNWCSSMLLPVKSVCSLFPEAEKSIPEVGSGSHCTTCDITLHISLHRAFQCASGWIKRSTSPIRCHQWLPSMALSAELRAPPSEEQEDHAQLDDVMCVRDCF